MIRKLLLLGATAAVAATPALSQEVEFSGNVTLTTDYHWRGLTQSNQDFAVQGGFDLAAGGFYAGTWASTIDFEDGSDSNVEWDIYGGYAGALGNGLGYDVGVIGYIYPDSDDEDLDFVELYGGLSYDSEAGFGVSSTLYVDPDNETVYIEGGAGFSFTDALSADIGLGTWLDGGDDLYEEEFNYNIGATYSVAGFDFDLRYYDIDIDGADDNVVFSVGRAM
ncbi:MAG: TorF family putative porin [Pseudomonadota bacterium]